MAYRLEGHIPNEFVGIMVSRLCERHPVPGKTIVLRGLSSHSMPHPDPKCRCTASGMIYPSTGPEVLIDVCFGAPDSPRLMSSAMQTIAHEYRHALQFYRDGFKYKGKDDKRLEDDADAFARTERKAMRDAGHDYLSDEDRRKGWAY